MHRQPAATDVALKARDRRSGLSRVLWLGLSFLILCLAAGMILLHMPVSIVADKLVLPSQVVSVSGSLRSGEAVLRGGFRARWTVATPTAWPPRMWLDTSLQGEKTDVQGSFGLGWRALEIRDVQGVVSDDVLALAPNTVPVVDCTGQLSLDMARILIKRMTYSAEGSANLNAGSCALSVNNRVDFPALDLSLRTNGQGILGVLTATTQPTVQLGQMRVSPHRQLYLRVEREGAQLIDGFPSSEPTVLEMAF